MSDSCDPSTEEMVELFDYESERILDSGPSVFRQEGRGWVGDEELRRAA